jgi:hypothetical protein
MGLGSGKKPISDPGSGSRGQKGTGSRIRNNGSNKKTFEQTTTTGQVPRWNSKYFPTSVFELVVANLVTMNATRTQSDPFPRSHTQNLNRSANFPGHIFYNLCRSGKEV